MNGAHGLFIHCNALPSHLFNSALSSQGDILIFHSNAEMKYKFL